MKNLKVNRIKTNKAWRKVVSLLLALSVIMCTIVSSGVNAVMEGPGFEGEMPHTHNWSTEWTSGPNGHWLTCDGCTEVSDFGVHILDNGVVTVPATEFSTGIMTYTCIVCNYIKEEIIPQLEPEVPEHVHNWDMNWTSDNYNHWHTCESCDEITDFSEHVWGTVVDEFGTTTSICTVCSAIKADDATEHVHNWNEFWVSDDFSHWHICNDCGEIADFSEHVWINGEITILATEFESGVITYYCAVCPAMKTEIYQLGQVYCGIPYEHTHTDSCWGWTYAPEPSTEEPVWGIICGLVEHTHDVACYTVQLGDLPQGDDTPVSGSQIECFVLYRSVPNGWIRMNTGSSYQMNIGDTVEFRIWLDGSRDWYVPIDIDSKIVSGVVEQSYDHSNNLNYISVLITADNAGDYAFTAEFYNTPSIKINIHVNDQSDGYAQNVIYVDTGDGNYVNHIVQGIGTKDNPFVIYVGDTLKMLSRHNKASFSVDGNSVDDVQSYYIEPQDNGGKTVAGITYRTFKAVRPGECVVFVDDNYGGNHENGDALYIRVEFGYGKIYVDRTGDGKYEYIETSESNPLVFNIGDELRIVSRYSDVKGTSSNDIPNSTKKVFKSLNDTNDGTNYYRNFIAESVGQTWFASSGIYIYVKVTGQNSNEIYVDVTYHNTPRGDISYGYQHVDKATAMVSGNVTTTEIRNEWNQVTGYKADFDSAPGNSADNPYIMYVGETIKLSTYSPLEESPHEIGYPTNWGKCGYWGYENDKNLERTSQEYSWDKKVVASFIALSPGNTSVSVTSYDSSGEGHVSTIYIKVLNTIYVNDANMHYLWRYDFGKDGAPQNGKVVYDANGSPLYWQNDENHRFTISSNAKITLKAYEYNRQSAEWFYGYASGSDKRVEMSGISNDTLSIYGYDFGVRYATFSDANESGDVQSDTISFQFKNKENGGSDYITFNILAEPVVPRAGMYVDVVFSNSSYDYVDIDTATAMITGNVTAFEGVHEGATKWLGDMDEYADANSAGNRFIIYVGETTTVYLPEGFELDGQGAQDMSKPRYLWSSQDTGNRGGVFDDTTIILGPNESYDSGDGKIGRKITVTGLKVGPAQIQSGSDVFYIDVRYPIYVVTALGEKHMNYINEYVYTANDWWMAKDNPYVRRNETNTIFGPDGLPIFIKNHQSYAFGFYRLIEGQEIYLTSYTEVGDTTRFEYDYGEVSIIEQHDEIVVKDGKQYRKVTAKIKAGWVDADTNGAIKFGSEIFDLRVYNIESDSANDTGNHFDIEKTDGGLYIITIEDPEHPGTYIKYTFNAYVTDINGCNVYDKNNRLLEELSAGEYYERGQPENSSQYELTSAYWTDGEGNLRGGFPDPKQRKSIKVSDIGSVVFDLQLELDFQGAERVDINGKPVDENRNPVQKGQNKYYPTADDQISKLTELASVSVDMRDQEIIDAYNKCPNHFGLDFTLKKEIYATRQVITVNKNLIGGTLEDKMFTFKVYRNNPNVKVGDGNGGLKYPSPTAYGYNDAEGLLHFWAWDEETDDNGNVINKKVRTINMLAFTNPGTYTYYLKEDVETSDGIVYDTKLIAIVVVVKRANGNNNDESSPLIVDSTNYYWANGRNTSTVPGFGWNRYNIEEGEIPTFENHVISFELPATGGAGTERYLIFGIGLLIIGFLLLFLHRRERGSRLASVSATESSNK